MLSARLQDGPFGICPFCPPHAPPIPHLQVRKQLWATKDFEPGFLAMYLGPPVSLVHQLHSSHLSTPGSQGAPCTSRIGICTEQVWEWHLEKGPQGVLTRWVHGATFGPRANVSSHRGGRPLRVGGTGQVRPGVFPDSGFWQPPSRAGRGRSLDGGRSPKSWAVQHRPAFSSADHVGARGAQPCTPPAPRPPSPRPGSAAPRGA